MHSAENPCLWLENAVHQGAERTFIETARGARYSYAQTYELSGQLVAALRECNVEPGDRVVVQAEKSAEYVLLYLACVRLGAIFLPLNTAYTLAELEYFLGDADPKLFIVDPEQRSAVETISNRPQTMRIETLDGDGDGSLMSIASRMVADTSRVDASPDDTAVLLYTSGTTGRSKGAMLTRANLFSNAEALVSAWRFNAADILLHALPIFHIHGLLVATNTVLASGASMLMLPKFDAKEVIALFKRATVFMGVPTFYTRLLQQADLTQASTAAMRLFISGSAPLLSATHHEFQERTGHMILERYGMSETLMNTSNPYDGKRIPGSVGPPLPGVEVRITDPDTASVSDTNHVGMIEVRGPNVFKGYWRRPEKTQAELRVDGFFITGDLGKIDERGYVYIVGRGKDLIITGGYNVYPKEVESELDALPGVAESAVIGVPHPDFGEGVTAVVVPLAGYVLDTEQLKVALEARLAKYKLPKHIVIVAELPRNTMGKVQKNVLRQRYSALYT